MKHKMYIQRLSFVNKVGHLIPFKVSGLKGIFFCCVLFPFVQYLNMSIHEVLVSFLNLCPLIFILMSFGWFT
jgi:hypothetical protein